MSVEQTMVLKSVFAGVDKKSLDALRAVARSVTYPPNTKLIHQGAIEHTLYIVVDGRIAITQSLEDGQERLLSMIGPIKMFGEMALIDDSPRIANCTTLTEVTVLEIDEEIFDQVMQTSPVVASTILRRVLESARQLDKSAIEDLTNKNADLQKALVDLQAAQAEIVEKERLERELEVAEEMQRNLLPQELPQFDDVGFTAYLQPARHIGGDFYDVVALDDDHVGILLGDVADKGIHAALFMAVARTLFLQESKQSLSPARVAEMVHAGIMDIAANDDVFVTAFYGVLHRPSLMLTYVRAAQERPFLFRPGTGVTALPGDGRFLGMLPDLTLEEYTVQLQPKDRLVLFSDGVPDAHNPGLQPFGNGRLAETIAESGHGDAEDVLGHIVRTVDAWSLDADAADDLTLLVVELK